MPRHRAQDNWTRWADRKSGRDNNAKKVSAPSAEQAFNQVALEGEEEDADALMTSEEEDDHPCVMWIKRATDSSNNTPCSARFQLAVALVILLNVLVMALQANYPEIPPGAGLPEGKSVWSVLNGIFLVLFTLELAFRFITFGCQDFFCKGGPKGEDLTWNWFDFAVVSAGWLDVLSKFFLPHQKGSNLVQIIRIVRILRMLRVIRLFKQLRKLRMLVKGLSESVSIVAWILVMMIMMILIVAIFCTSTIGHQYAEWGEDADDIHKYWGTVPNSMQTLFQYLTLDDWGMISRLVCKKMGWMMPIFILYVVFAAFVVLSLLTGVMAEHMNAVRREEDEKLKQESHSRMLAAIRVFYKAFRSADTEADGVIAREEFATIFMDKQFAKQLQNFDVDLQGINAEDIFKCLDLDNDGSITWEEFKFGLIELREAVTPKQIIMLRNRIQRAIEASDESQRKVMRGTGKVKPEHLEACLAECNLSFRRAERIMDDVEGTFDDFCNHFGVQSESTGDEEDGR